MYDFIYETPTRMLNTKLYKKSNKSNLRVQTLRNDICQDDKEEIYKMKQNTKLDIRWNLTNRFTVLYLDGFYI